MIEPMGRAAAFASGSGLSSQEEDDAQQIDQIEASLRAYGGYAWLLDQPDRLWSAREVAEALTGAGMPVSEDYVGRWYASGAIVAQDFGGKGRRASSRALARYFLSLLTTAEDREGENT